MRIIGRSSLSNDERSSSQLAGLLHTRATPRKAEVAEWGYNWHTARGRRDWCATCMLCTLLVACAITVSGLTSPMRLIYIQGDRCKNRESTLSSNLILMQNITNYYEARQTASTTVNMTATAYYLANNTYNSLGTSYEWPAPYDLSEEDRQALEIEARESGDDCETVEECVGGILGWIRGIRGEDTCVSAEVSCPDIEVTAILVEKSRDLSGNVTVLEYNTSLAQTALDQATGAIIELVRGINVASSIYVLYLAFLVVVTPPFIVYGARWKRRVIDGVANIIKPMCIALIIIVWYAHEFFQSAIDSNFYSVIWANFLEDPCWADPEFLTNTSVEISNTCKDITSARNLFNQASANYRYYEQVENTWWAAIGDVAPDGPFYGDPETELIQTFPSNCSSTALLEAIQPSDGTVNWWSLFFHSGALVALLLQLVLAYWFIAWFSVLRPLTMNRGRVTIPESSRTDASLYREVHDFARARAILPFVISTLVLIFLLVNLGASSSDRDMWKKVLIGALVLAGFQFVVVPLLIWRPSDERITSTKPTGSPDSPSESIDGLTSDPSFGLRSLRDDSADRSSFRLSEHSTSLMPRSLGVSIIGGGVGVRGCPPPSPPNEGEAEKRSLASMSSSTGGWPLLFGRLGSSRTGKNKAKVAATRQSRQPDDYIIGALETGENNKKEAQTMEEGEEQLADIDVLGKLKPSMDTNNKSSSSIGSMWCGRLRSTERGLNNKEEQKVEEKEGEEQLADIAVLGKLKPSRDTNNKSSSSIGSSMWRGRLRSTERGLNNEEEQKVEEREEEEQLADIAVLGELKPSGDTNNKSSSSIGNIMWCGRLRSTECGLSNKEEQKVEEKEGEEQLADIAVLGKLKPSRDMNNKSSSSSISSSMWRRRLRSTERGLSNEEGPKVGEKEGEEHLADIAVLRKLKPSGDTNNKSSSSSIGSSIGSSIWRGRLRSTERDLGSEAAAVDKRPTSAEESLASALEAAMAAIQGAEAVASASGRGHKSRRK